MNRRHLLLLSSCAAFIPLAGPLPALAQEQGERIRREELQATLSDRARLAGMLFAVDTLRLVLALAVARTREEAYEMVIRSRDAYLALRQRVEAMAGQVARMIATLADDALQLSEPVLRLVLRTERILIENGIAAGSKLAREMSTSFRMFLKTAELAAINVQEWFCRDYPMRAACG